MMMADEIPIWICGEPRFISGITCTTTCREIIAALIDDELCNNNGRRNGVAAEGVKTIQEGKTRRARICFVTEFFFLYTHNYYPLRKEKLMNIFLT